MLIHINMERIQNTVVFFFFLKNPPRRLYEIFSGKKAQKECICYKNSSVFLPGVPETTTVLP